ncbi:hypothetical protein FMK65_07845 [Klebsiella variicola]|nr:hypothetical protein [Klebsiella variicola]MBZ7174612.1 hypothetical protein [Klebsiella variicola]
MKNEIEQIAQQNEMSIEFVTWFFNEKKETCGNVWFMMMAAMWEGWKGRSIEMDKLAAENVALKGALTGSAYISFIKANGWNTSASTVNGKFVNFADPEVDFGSMVFAHAKKLIEAVETPATDRIVAGIKADGVVQAANECYGAGYICETLLAYAQQLREGADK